MSLWVSTPTVITSAFVVGTDRGTFFPPLGWRRTSLRAHRSRGEADTTAMGLLPRSASFYKVTPISVRWLRCPRSGRRITSEALLQARENMGQTGRRSSATHILTVKIALAVAHFHRFGVARRGP